MNVEAFKITPTSTFVKVRGLQAEAPHVPLHIIAVIDVSGSMAGERLDNVKNSLNHMVPMMTEEDSFSLIAFSDSAHIHCEDIALNAAGIATVQDTVNNLRPICSTNMSAALIAARDIVGRTPCDKKVCILLLTDGHVNGGIREVDPLNVLANSIRDVSRPAPRSAEMVPTSISLFAVGYGADHNYSLLQSFARDGGGSYQVVNTLEHVASVFGDMLGGMQTIVAQNVEILMPATAKALTGLRVTSDTGGQQKVQLGDIYAGAQNALIIDNMPVAVDNVTQSINYRYFDVQTMAMVSGSCVIALESGPEIIREGSLFMLKQNMATLMNRIATGAIPNADLRNEIQAAIDELRPNAAEPWVAAMITNFERQIRLIEYQGAAVASRGISGIAANNAAVLAMNRGVAMMSQDPDDMYAHTSADMFSTPAQQMRSGGIVRGVSGPVVPYPNVGGGSGLTRSGLSGGMATLDPFNSDGSINLPRPVAVPGTLPPFALCRQVAGEFVPPMPPPMPPISRAMAVIIPPPPTIEELEADVPPDAGYMTPRNQIRTIDPTNPPPAPIRNATEALRNPETGEPSPKRTRVTFTE
jgi:Ca-activated chloride channel family protein